jgi:hypothetical protein
MNSVTIAPHLLRALESMSKDMAVEPQALVNQAVFAWLRINGYVLPSNAALPAVAPSIQPVVPAVAPAPPKVEPEPLGTAAPVAPTSSMPSSQSLPRDEPVAALVAPPPTAVTPEADRASALARMSAIAVDLGKLTRPWPAWAPEPEPDEEDEDEDEQDDAPSAEQDDEADEDDADEATEARAPVVEDEGPPPDEHTGETPAPADANDDDEPEPVENTGETEVEPPADSTVVLRSVPIVLYLERDGEEPVRVHPERFIIGRGTTCDMVIDSPRVSREHLAITRSGVRYFIEDLNSSNGTWFGEERVTKREIESGDVIILGNEAVTFVLRAD